jgi:hypothetical protein
LIFGEKRYFRNRRTSPTSSSGTIRIGSPLFRTKITELTGIKQKLHKYGNKIARSAFSKQKQYGTFSSDKKVSDIDESR